MLIMNDFFTALNPCSKNAGLQIKAEVSDKTIFFDGKDLTLYESLENKIHSFLSVKRGLTTDYFANVFHMMSLVGGEHHPALDAAILRRSLDSENEILGHGFFHNDEIGSKGLLDFLIFPLLARKLMADTFLESREDAYLFNVLAWVIAVPLEIMRDVAVVSLTLFLALTVAPLVTIVQQFIAPNKDDSPESEMSQLKATQDHLTDNLVKAKDERGDKRAAEHIRQSAPGQI